MRIATLKRMLIYLLSVWIGLCTSLVAYGSEINSAYSERVVADAGGILKVYSNIKGARVFLNDEEVGKTPTIRLLPPGKYRVRLIVPGYEIYEEEIEILANKAVTINAQLAKVVGAVEILANIEGALVLLDGKEVGTTPNVVLEDLPSGTYRIQVEKPGYATYVGPVTVKPNVRLRLKIDLQASAGRLNVRSVPEGATIFLDEKSMGVTPLQLDSVDSGRHTIRLELQDHAVVYRVIQVNIGEKVSVSADLKTVGGGVKVKTSDPGADVYLEGNLIGQTPLRMPKNIQPGQYSLRVSRQGYADYVQPVTIERKRTARVSADLVPLETASKRSAPGTQPVTTSSGSILERWWFWTAVGGVTLVAAGGTTAAVLSGDGASIETTGDVVVALP